MKKSKQQLQIELNELVRKGATQKELLEWSNREKIKVSLLSEKLEEEDLMTIIFQNQPMMPPHYDQLDQLVEEATLLELKDIFIKILTRKISLEEIYDTIPWERKFERIPPTRSKENLKIWKQNDFKKAKTYLEDLDEETDEFFRSLWLFSDSTGEKLALLEEKWEEEKRVTIYLENDTRWCYNVHINGIETEDLPLNSKTEEEALKEASERTDTEITNIEIEE